MTQELEFIYNEIESFKNRKKSGEKLSFADVTYIKLLEQSLTYIKENIIKNFFIETLDQVKLEEYKQYLKEEIKRRTITLDNLSSKRAELEHANFPTKKIDKSIARVKEKLDKAKKELELVSANFAQYLASYKTKSISKMLRIIFEAPIEGSTSILNHTRHEGSNDFLTQDEKTGEERLNRANAYLFLEVYGEHKIENLKKIAQIEELEKNLILSVEELEAQKKAIAATIPVELQGATTHVFDMFCHYSSNYVRAISSMPPEKITEEVCSGDESLIKPALNHIRLALIVNSTYDFTPQDLQAIIGEQRYEQDKWAFAQDLINKSSSRK